MAPAIVHFLVGASLLVLLAAPLAVRYRVVRRHGLALATVGGLWGVFPDLHHVAPRYEGPLRSFHQSAWVDLFAFHYTLDLDPVRAVDPAQSGLAAVLVFVGVVAVYTLASEWGARHDLEPIEPRYEMIGGAAGGAVVSTVLLGGIFQLSGHLEGVAAIVGRDGVLVGWIVVALLGVLSAGVFAVCIELATGEGVRIPTATAVGTLGAAQAWLIATTLVVPLWRMRLFGDTLHLSIGDPTGLGAFVLAGGALGAIYATVVAALRERGPRRGSLGHPTK